MLKNAHWAHGNQISTICEKKRGDWSDQGNEVWFSAILQIAEIKKRMQDGKQADESHTKYKILRVRLK